MKYSMYAPKTMTSVSECLEAIEAIETAPENYPKADRQRFYEGSHCTPLKAAQSMIDRINKRVDELCPDDEKEESTAMEFAYARVSTDVQNTDGQEADIASKYPKASITIEHGVSGTVPAKERPELARLLDKLRKGDTLVVWWIDRLGRDYHDAENVIRELLQKGVCIKTINQDMIFAYTGNDMQDMTTNIQITMVTAMAAAERKTRLASAEAARQTLRKDKKAWTEKFAGRKANTDNHSQIIKLLEEGNSIRKVAEMVGVNPSTVQRVKKAQS